MWVKKEYKPKDPLQGMVVGVIGSSSMDTQRASINFMERIYIDTGCIIHNNARFGSRLTAVSEDYTADSTNQLKMLDDLPSTVDMVIVQPGMNDDRGNYPLGTWESTSYTEFYFCLHEMCKKLYTKYPTIPKGCLTGQYYGDQTARSSLYHNAVVEVFNYYGIPVLDLRSEGNTPYNILTWRTAHCLDDLHLNTLGNKVLARRVESFMRMLLGK